MWRPLMAHRMVRQIVARSEEECWARVRTKAAVLPPAEVEPYVRVQAAGFAHRAVDEVVRSHADMDGQAANHLIVRASDSLTTRILKRLQRAKLLPTTLKKVDGPNSRKRRTHAKAITLGTL
jgi:hypothetical protein